MAWAMYRSHLFGGSSVQLRGFPYICPDLQSELKSYIFVLDSINFANLGLIKNLRIEDYQFIVGFLRVSDCPDVFRTILSILDEGGLIKNLVFQKYIHN